MMQSNNKTTENGSVLIVTIWVVMALASLVLVIARQIRVQSIEVSNQLAGAKADAIIAGAVEYCKSQLSNEDTDVEYSTSAYEAIEVGDGFFWIIRANLSDDRNYDYGLSDEAGKINLNSASLEMLLKLPSMSSELASSIIDWRDQDSEITTGGAENEYYLLLNDKYNCKNANLETIEEVLLIKGSDSKILFGEDRNLNGILDENENDAEKSTPSDNSNGRLDPGFYNYVTVYSYEKNVDSEGEERINVSDMSNQSQLSELLQSTIGESGYFQIMDNIRASAPFENLIEVYYASGMTYDQFVKIIDKITTVDEEETVGLINVNTACEEVLLCLPGLEQSDVDSLISKREGLDEELDTILWVTKALDETKSKAIGSYITVQSYQYSADIVAVSKDGRAFRRYSVIMDTLDSGVNIVYKKPLTHLRWPLDDSILENLRQGKELQ